MNEETGYVCRQCMEKIDEDNYVELHPNKFCSESCLENFLDNHPDLIPTCGDEAAVYFGNVGWNREDNDLLDDIRNEDAFRESEA